MSTQLNINISHLTSVTWSVLLSPTLNTILCDITAIYGHWMLTWHHMLINMWQSYIASLILKTGFLDFLKSMHASDNWPYRIFSIRHHGNYLRVAFRKARRQLDKATWEWGYLKAHLHCSSHLWCNGSRLSHGLKNLGTTGGRYHHIEWSWWGVEEEEGEGGERGRRVEEEGGGGGRGRREREEGRGGRWRRREREEQWMVVIVMVRGRESTNNLKW